MIFFFPSVFFYQMNLYFHVIAPLLIVFSLFIYCLLKNYAITDTALLVIGILSARQNFDLRTQARSSWLKYYQENNSIKAWFIIGKDDCVIPPAYRSSVYGCEKWNISKSGLTEHFYSSQVGSGSCDSKKVFKQGFSFRVNHPVVVKKLGALFHLLQKNSPVKVALLDIQSKEVFVQTTISQNHSSLENGYLYENIEPILLPKHYEGMVLVEGYFQTEACVNILWNNGGGVITFNRIYSTPSHLESIKFTNDVYSAANIQFFVHDLDTLNALILAEDNATAEWLTHLQNTDEKLTEEIIKHQDILLVDVMDVYRNLPIKLLHFYKWVHQNYKFQYLMKTDDDTVVSVKQLVEHMKRHSHFNPYEMWLWSWFRKDWPVNYIGKWSDYDYKSSLYPAFPCGALYVLSYKTVQWLSLNVDFLFPYQGEDVSVGIWLSAVKANFIEDENFQCDSACNKNSYNRAQLTVPKMNEVWSIYETCQNLCSCD